MPLDPDIAMLIIEVDANLSHAESITHGLTQQQFEWRPERGRWSIGECFAHLNLVNGPSLQPLEASIKEGRVAGRTGQGPFHYGFITRKFIASQELPAKKRMKAPKGLLPLADNEMQKTLSEYRRIANEFKRLSREANGLHLERVKTPLPLLPAALRSIVKMPIGGRIALVTTHDRRHLWQAEQVRNDPGFPA